MHFSLFVMCFFYCEIYTYIFFLQKVFYYCFHALPALFILVSGYGLCPRTYILKCNVLIFISHYRIRLIENKWKLKL